MDQESDTNSSQGKEGGEILDAPLTSALVQSSKKTFNLLLLVAITLFIAGGTIIYLTTRPYHIYIMGFIAIFSAFEAGNYRSKVRKHIPYLDILPVTLASFSAGFLVALGVLLLNVKLILPLVAPISILLFIILNLILVFLSDVAHTLIALEFIKKMLKLRLEDNYKENIFIATAITPGKQSLISGLRSIIGTALIMTLLAVLLTFAVTSSMERQFDQLEDIPEENLKIPPIQMDEYQKSLKSVQQLLTEHQNLNQRLIADRDSVLEKREILGGSLPKDTWNLISGDLFETLSEAQKTAAGLNAIFYSASLDFKALQHAMQYAQSPRASTEGFYISAGQMDELEQEVSSQREHFNRIRDEKFGMRLPIDTIKTELGDIDIKKMLPSAKADSSILGSLYLGLFESTSFYRESQAVLESLQSTRINERDRIDSLESTLSIKETDQSRYIRLNLLLTHLANYNADHCTSLTDSETADCLKTVNLINARNCEIIEDSTAYESCKEP